MHNQIIGQIGEDIASRYLIKKGYSIISKNYRTKLGEIDIISQYKNKYVFVEVKTKILDEKGKPYEHVTASKLAKFKRVVTQYIRENKINSSIHLDVVSIELNPDLSLKNILHFENITQ